MEHEKQTCQILSLIKHKELSIVELITDTINHPKLIILFSRLSQNISHVSPCLHSTWHVLNTRRPGETSVGFQNLATSSPSPSLGARPRTC